MNKICTKCKLEKSLDYFYKDKQQKSGIRPICIICTKTGQKNYRQTDLAKETKKHYVNENRSYINRLKRESRLRNLQTEKNWKKIYYNKNKEEIRIKHKEYYELNKEKIHEQMKQKYHEDIQYKLALNLRRRMHKLIRREDRNGSAVRDLGCSLEFFKSYLESKFTNGMTWDNYGQWHLDHIYPLSIVDLTNKEEFIKVAHYTNYQPLWARDNIKKGNKIINEGCFPERKQHG